jgi:hypothetical protein
MSTREALQRLIAELPEDQLDIAWRLLDPLCAAVDPVLHAFMNAPEDDEPLTPDEIAAIEEGKADVARGDVIAWEAYLAERRAAT